MGCSRPKNDYGGCVKGVLGKNRHNGKEYNLILFSILCIDECFRRRVHYKEAMRKVGELVQVKISY